jgi:hypothetical protein
MKKRLLIHILCLLTVVCMSLAMGCNAFSAHRNRKRMHTMRTDLDRMVDDVDWILGFHEPTQLYDQSRP